MKDSKRIDSIDGLRALSIIMIILYHIDTKVLSGGFLAVDMFFILSGYLLITNLNKKYEKNENLSLKSIYKRRFLKNVPLLYLVISSSLIFMVLFNKYMLEKTHMDAWYSYIFLGNWWFIFKKVDYFDKFSSVSPFKHLWYMGVLAQVSLLIILSYVFFHRRKNVNTFEKRKTNQKYLNFLLMLTVISLILNISIFNGSNFSRVYYGSDTRAFSILLGAIFAIIYPIDNFKKDLTDKKNILLTIVSSLAIGIFIYLTITVDESSILLYKGGFFLIDLLCLVILITSSHINTYISKFLSLKPLNYLGKISYSLYLWHFPVIILTRASKEIGYPTFLPYAMRLGISFLLTVYSLKLYNYLFANTNSSKPYKLALSRYLAIIKSSKSKLIYAINICAILILLLGLTGLAIPGISTLFVKDQRVVMKESFKHDKTANNPGKIEIDKKDSPNNENNSKNNSPIEQGKDLEKNPEKEKLENKKSNDNLVKNKGNEANQEQAAKNNPEQIKNPYKSLILIGDSLAINLGEKITDKYPDAIVDAAISRQLYDSYPIAEKYSYMDSKDNVVVFVLGTNGLFTKDQMDELISYFPQSDIYFLNTRFPSNQQDKINNVISSNVENYPRVRLIDWKSFVEENLDILEPDNTHVTYDGANKMLEFIEKNLIRPINTKQ